MFCWLQLDSSWQWSKDEISSQLLTTKDEVKVAIESARLSMGSTGAAVLMLRSSADVVQQWFVSGAAVASGVVAVVVGAAVAAVGVVCYQHSFML